MVIAGLLADLVDVWLSNNPNCVSKFNQFFSRHTWSWLNAVITANFSFNYVWVSSLSNKGLTEECKRKDGKKDTHLFNTTSSILKKKIQKSQMGHIRRARVCKHMRTVKDQIRLRIRAVWSGPLLFADRIIGYYRKYEWKTKCPLYILFACAG